MEMGLAVENQVFQDGEFVRNDQGFSCFFSHRIHVWYIYLHLVDFYGKCR